MKDMKEFQRRLMVVFLEELHECVGDMDRHLQSLLKNPEPQVCEMLKNELYRAAHKMKGAASSAQVPQIQKLCLQMQNILTSIRDGHRRMDNTPNAAYRDITASRRSIKPTKQARCHRTCKFLGLAVQKAQIATASRCHGASFGP